MGRPLVGYALILHTPRLERDVYPEGLTSPRDDWPVCLTLSLPVEAARLLRYRDAHFVFAAGL